MLYDKRWDAKIEQKADPLSPAAFVAWLETKKPTERYNYWNCNGGCLLDQFLKHAGMDDSGESYRMISSSKIGTTEYGYLACNWPFTFGAALERARAALR